MTRITTLYCLTIIFIFQSTALARHRHPPSAWRMAHRTALVQGLQVPAPQITVVPEHAILPLALAILDTRGNETCGYLRGDPSTPLVCPEGACASNGDSGIVECCDQRRRCYGGATTCIDSAKMRKAATQTGLERFSTRTCSEKSKPFCNMVLYKDGVFSEYGFWWCADKIYQKNTDLIAIFNTTTDSVPTVTENSQLRSGSVDSSSSRFTSEASRNSRQTTSQAAEQPTGSPTGSPTLNPTTDSNSRGVSMELIVGIGVGASILVVGVFAAVIMILWQKRKKKQESLISLSGVLETPYGNKLVIPLQEPTLPNIDALEASIKQHPDYMNGPYPPKTSPEPVADDTIAAPQPAWVASYLSKPSTPPGSVSSRDYIPYRPGFTSPQSSTPRPLTPRADLPAVIELQELP